MTERPTRPCLLPTQEIAGRRGMPPRRDPDAGSMPVEATPPPKPLGPAGEAVDPWDPENWWP